jgi:uncharacterized lipoprotein YmbA
MIRIATWLPGAGAALLLGACASAPLHYYTLVPPATTGATAAAGSAASLRFELLAVGVPAQVDQPQLVVRQGGQGVALLDGQRWIAPLGDEVRSALSVDLAHELPGQDVTGLPGGDKPVLRIKLDLRRFDSEPGSYALIEGAWSVRVLHDPHNRVLACTSNIRETVGLGYDALVQGHQRAINHMAEQIATVARALGNGQSASCPSS